MDKSELKNLRTKRLDNMTQVAFARALNVSLPTLTRWESGEVPVPEETSKTLQCLSAFLDELPRTRKGITLEDLREALMETGVVSVLAGAAAAGAVQSCARAATRILPARPGRARPARRGRSRSGCVLPQCRRRL